MAPARAGSHRAGLRAAGEARGVRRAPRQARGAPRRAAAGTSHRWRSPAGALNRCAGALTLYWPGRRARRRATWLQETGRALGGAAHMIGDRDWRETHVGPKFHVGGLCWVSLAALGA